MIKCKCGTLKVITEKNCILLFLVSINTVLNELSYYSENLIAYFYSEKLHLCHFKLYFFNFYQMMVFLNDLLHYNKNFKFTVVHYVKNKFRYLVCSLFASIFHFRDRSVIRDFWFIILLQLISSTISYLSFLFIGWFYATSSCLAARSRSCRSSFT